MKLNLKNTTKTVKKETSETDNEIKSTSLKLKLSPDKTYDLDELIESVRRDTTSSSILVQVDYSSNNSKSILYVIAQNVLKQNGIDCDASNFKTQVQLLPDFINLYETAVKKFYPLYTSSVNNLQEGNISISTVIEKVSASMADYYNGLSDKEFISDALKFDFSNNKPEIIINEGSQYTSDIDDMTVLDSVNVNKINAVEKLMINGTDINDIINSSVNNENERATNAESELLSKINDEIEKARNNENLIVDQVNKYINENDETTEKINDKISSNTNSIQTLASKLNASDYTTTAALTKETERATNAESELLSKINDEVSRAKETESHISQVSATSIGVIQSVDNPHKVILNLLNENDNVLNSQVIDLDSTHTLDTAILNYAAKKVILTFKDGHTYDCDISELINNFNTDINSEKERAIEIENNIQTNLVNEVKRATEVETKLENDITNVNNTISSLDYTSTNTTDKTIVKLTQDNGLINAEYGIIQINQNQVNNLTTDLEVINNSISTEITTRQEKDAETLASAKEYTDSKSSDILTDINSKIDTINSKIPSQASSNNQLADKEFVNSSISTATATFRGLVSTLDELKALSGDLNDYAIVKTTDNKGNVTQYDRYKYSSTSSSETGNWLLEYTLNNSTFTDAQWKALNSGATEESLAQIITNKDLIVALSKKLTDEISNRKTTDENLTNHIADINNPHKVTKSQVGLGNVDNTSDASLFTDISNTDTNLSLTIGGTTKSILDINAKSAITDGNGNNIVNTYALKSDIANIDSTYIDSAEKTVNITLENNTDVSLTNSPYTVNITIPSTVTHGFRSIIQFENKTDITQVNVTNNSVYNLLTMQNGDIVTSKIQYSTNEIVRLYFDCDGLYTYMYVQEIYK